VPAAEEEAAEVASIEVDEVATLDETTSASGAPMQIMTDPASE
jgi:hypothetical protein